NNRHRPLKFTVGDMLYLKVSLMKGVVCFGMKGNLALRFIRPFEITEHVGVVAYRLALPT
ncbi:hypothetical protein PJP10_32680, partial [Mycobacterium kansasii]